MRTLFTLISNLFRVLLSLLALPLWLARRRGAFYLAVELRGDLPWRAGPRRWRFRRAQRPLGVASVKDFAELLERAAGDRRVLGIVVRIEGFTGPSARLQAIRQQLEKFQQAGKKVAFYGRAVTMREYALMTCADRLQLAPGGHVDLKGYCAELTVLGGALEKVGVRAHFVRRAEYKTAPERFTEREVSAAQRETTAALLEDAFAGALSDIARGRQKGEDEVRAWIDAGPFGARRALEQGLVDAVGDGEDLEIALAPQKSPRARLVAMSSYRADSPFAWPGLLPLRPKPRVAVVRISGTIALGESARLPLIPKVAGSDSVAQALRRAREDKSIRAVVLHVDSPGGSSLASELMLRAVRRLAEAKPTVAYVDRLAASGGYLAMMGCKQLVCAPLSIVGSIGVFGGKFDISRLLARLGIGSAQIKLGANAGLESPLSGFSEQERASLEREIEETYREFLGTVAQGRAMPVEKVEPLAGGRVYTAQRALKLGLIDALGGFEDAVRKACELASIPGEPELVAIEGPARTLLALRGPKASWALLKQLVPGTADRTFAAADWWPRIDPEL